MFNSLGVEVGGADEDLPLGGPHQVADHPVELVAPLAQAHHGGHGDLPIVGLDALEAVLAEAQTLLEAADRSLELLGAGDAGAIQPLDGLAAEEDVIHVVDHAAGQCRAVDLVIAIEAVALLLVQVDVVEAGAGVKQGVVEDEALEVQHPEQLAALDRHAVDLDLVLVAGGHGLVHQVVAPCLPLPIRPRWARWKSTNTLMSREGLRCLAA